MPLIEADPTSHAAMVQRRIGRKSTGAEELGSTDPPSQKRNTSLLFVFFVGNKLHGAQFISVRELLMKHTRDDTPQNSKSNPLKA